MIFFNKDAICEFFIAFNKKLLFFLVAYHFAGEPKFCKGFRSAYSAGSKGAVLVDSGQEVEIPDVQTFSSFDSKSSDSNHPCQYFTLSKRLICKGQFLKTGSINFTFLKDLHNKNINDFIIENYEGDSRYRQIYWSRHNLETGEWYMKLPKVYRQLNGEIVLKDTGVQLDVILRISPRRNADGFLIEGEAFSNKVIKISWRVKGELSLKLVRNTTIISLDMGSVEGDDWKLQSNLTFERRNPDSEFDEWKIFGIITTDYDSENQLVLYKGRLGTTIIKEECNFLGEIKLLNVNVVGLVSGSAAPPQNRQITIPQSAFANLTVKNIIFKNSNFYKDFNRNSLNGLKGVESIAFINTKLKEIPRLDELFKSLKDLEEIYIEGCTTLGLKFGSLAALEKVRRLSFKGSGPLEFNERSFVWLQNSNLTFLDLRNSHVKISSKISSLLWSVKRTLKHLDISHSTITEEKDLATLMNGLNIVTLEAESLKLTKVPTNALGHVRKTLRYLSLKQNNFKKIFEKMIFDSVLNFPTMINLIELNLEDCRINYIETGTFDNLPNLKILHLAHNNIENLQEGWTYIKPQVEYLGLMYNGRISPVPTPSIYNSDGTMNLNINKIIGSLRKSVRTLSLKNTGIEDLSENLLGHLTSLEELDLSFNKNLKTELFPLQLLKNFKKLKSLNLKQCRISGTSFYEDEIFGVDDFNDFLVDSLENLDLSFNNIKILDPKKLSVFPKLRILNLSGNSISGWKTSLHVSNKNLETLFLDENKIETLTDEMLLDIKKLESVKMGNNPFICGPYVYAFREIIGEVNRSEVKKSKEKEIESRQISYEEKDEQESEEELNPFMDIIYSNWKDQFHENQNMKILDWSDKNYSCFSWSQAKFIPFSEVTEKFESLPLEKNETKEITLLWVTLMAVVGIVITIAIICWKFLDVHLLTRAIRNAVALTFLIRGEKEPATYKYNAFVSYCDNDRSWVIEHLLPRLESRSDIKICLHERDFQVGLSILENITNSIDNSKNIILIVSRAFLRSQWCLYELHLAQYRLLEKGRDQLVLVFLENIPSVKRLKTLRYLMMTKTYLEWPVNPKSSKDVDAFWNRLMSSLVNVN